MKLQSLLLIGGAMLALTGCSNTVRMVTASQWITTGSSAPTGAPAAEIPAGGAAPAAPGAAPAAAPAGGGAQAYVLYVAYWEGSCSKGLFGGGCERGDSKIKRCNVSADNTMVCKDETEANRALSADTK
ncbi:MAG: hypothetical protein U0174_16810 [Polyangiaceae bacterium]